MKFCDYVKKNQTMWILIFLLNILCHGTMLLSGSIGIDTEDIITLKDLFYGGWLETGRQGLVLLKLLSDTCTFNPYLTGAVTLVMLTVAGILWTYLFTSITGKENKLATGSFAGLLSVSTVLTEQLYFKLQSMEISTGFVLMAVSLLLVYRGFSCSNKKRYVMILFSFLLNLVLFSMYQVMVALFIFGAAACIFLYCFCRERTEQEDTKMMWRFARLQLAVFLISFFVNQVTTALFFSGSDYLSSQISWFCQPFISCLGNIRAHIQEVLLGTQIYYPKTFAIYCLLLLIAVMIFFRSHKKGKALGIISLLLLYASPFYMTILCGQAPVMRSQLVLPFAVSFFAYVLFVMTERTKWKKYVTWFLMAVGLFTGYLQLRYTMQLNYTDTVRYASDVRLASTMIEKINELEDEDCSYPVVVIGSHPAELNNSCIRGEVIGYSFFEWDTQVEPYGYFNTRRVLGFLHTLGANYVQGDMEQTKAALEYSESMSSWPAKESVTLHDGVIIIKLSSYE